MESISKKIERLYNSFQDKQEDDSGTRYKSWEWCHKAFLDGKQRYRNANTDDQEKIVDLLCLHLAFYLASWGMYRGSTFLLQRDYKAHEKAVREIMNDSYKDLWDYSPQKESLKTISELLFNKDSGIYWKIKKSYGKDTPTETLVTKILLGTFGCIPAFDRYLKAGINCFCKGKDKDKCPIDTLENDPEKSFERIVLFAIANKDELKIETAKSYPCMKCVDMFFWEIGYEIDLAAALKNKKTKKRRQQKLLEVAARHDFRNLNLKETTKAIDSSNQPGGSEKI